MWDHCSRMKLQPHVYHCMTKQRYLQSSCTRDRLYETDFNLTVRSEWHFIHPIKREKNVASCQSPASVSEREHTVEG